MKLTADEVRESVRNGVRNFYCDLRHRRITLVGYDLDCGCTGYAWIWDAEGQDREALDLVDLSCLSQAGY